MQFNNSKSVYGIVSVAFHWATAVAFASMLAIGYWMTSLGFHDPLFMPLINLHKEIGFAFAIFVLARLGWKLTNMSPDAVGKAWEQITAKLVHSALYFGLCLMFVSGIMLATSHGRSLDVFGLFKVPPLFDLGAFGEVVAGVHSITAGALLSLVVVHALAALKHHFVDRDGVLLRMLGR